MQPRFGCNPDSDATPPNASEFKEFKRRSDDKQRDNYEDAKLKFTLGIEIPLRFQTAPLQVSNYRLTVFRESEPLGDRRVSPNPNAMNK